MRLFLCCLCLILLSGCAGYKVCTQAFLDEPPTEDKVLYENKKAALSHWLYRAIPRHRCQIKWYDIGHWTTWMLFGNDDDGIFGEEAHYRLDQKVTSCKALRWCLRNPLHNFCFYTIGSAHCRNSEITLLKIADYQVRYFRYSPYGTTNFAGKNTSFFLGLHGWKPFVSLRLVYSKTRSGNFYIGWRTSGNFGIKCNIAAKRKIR